jgi:hypothetical protein
MSGTFKELKDDSSVSFKYICTTENVIQYTNFMKEPKIVALTKDQIILYLSRNDLLAELPSNLSG